MLELLGKAQRPVLPVSFIAPSSGVLPCPHDDDIGQIGSCMDLSIKRQTLQEGSAGGAEN